MRVERPTTGAAANAAKAGEARTINNAELKKACKEFEAIFLLELLKQARLKLLADTGVDTPGKALLEQFALEELSQTLACSGTGISDLVYEALSRAGLQRAESCTYGASPHRP
ncbi:MAG TPA: hypothetical protein GXX40_04155 [Firmicutes bacterium]|nr:hypothetical protein [Bacillota bacterium]